MKHGVIAFFALLLTACTSYQVDDYGQDSTVETSLKPNPACADLAPEEKTLCQEREKKLVLNLMNNGHCKREYEYQENHCLKQKERTEQQLQESLKKHIK